ncbi:acetyl-CoA carboxylase biotin carboxyl carrier protein [Psychrobacillus soli]
MAEVREIFQLFNDSSVQEFLFEQDATKIALKKEFGATPATDTGIAEGSNAIASSAVIVQERSNEATVASPKELVNETATMVREITSTMVGTFYLRENPESDPYVEIGKKIQPDDVVCIVEAMKLFNEIEAEVHGEIIDILVEDGQVVEYGQALFLVKEL